MVTTLADDTTTDRDGAHAPARRALIALYGLETPNWAREAARTAPRSGVVRLIALDDGPPAFTSLLPAARRRFDAAGAAWRQQIEERRRTVIEILQPALLTATVVPVPSAGDPGRTIATYANEWPANLLIVAYDGRARLERALTGTVHERVARFARCPVLVIAADPGAPVMRVGRFPLRPRAAMRGAI